MKDNRKNHLAGRIISLFIVLCMVLAIAPITAFAGVEDITGDTPSTVYKHTYHTKVKMTANVTVQDSEGNTVNTYPVSEESDDFIVGNVSDDAVQAEITRLEGVVNSQLPSGAVKSNRTTNTIFDHFESSYILESSKDQTLIGDNAQDESGTTSTLDVHEYQIYEITDEWTVDCIINNVVINNAPDSCTVGEAPKAMATKGDGAYTFYEYWEEWTQTENGLEPVKFWYSDAQKMSRVPENQKITAFEEGKSYSYSIIAEANENYTFASEDALSVMLNGEEFTDKSQVILDGKSLMIGPGAFKKPVKPVTQKEIELIEINNATLNFKDGDKPVFTGTTPDDAPYALVFEEWRTDGEWTRSDEWFNDADHHGDDKDITAFDKNKSYNYNLYLKTTAKGSEENWYFGPDTKLKINGKEVSFARDPSDNEQQFTVTTGITMTPSAAGASDYQIIDGADSTWTQNSDGTLTVRANGDISKFTGVKVDGVLIGANNYTAVSGSTIITLKADYLKTLSAATHKITVVYTDGECSTNFEIKGTASLPVETTGGNEITTPQTGDNSHLLLWAALLLAGSSCIIGITLYNRKKRAGLN